MNPFLVTSAVLMIAGATWSLAHADWRMGVVYICYGVANYALAGAK